MRKQKRSEDTSQFNWNVFLQWILVMAIVASGLVLLDAAWLWWVPFVMLYTGYKYAACSKTEEATVTVKKRKRDGIR